MKTLRYYAISIAFLGTIMWLSDYRYDWALLLAGTFYGQFAIIFLEENSNE